MSEPNTSHRSDRSVNSFRNRRVAPSFFRANLLFLAPLPLLFSGIGELSSGNAIGAISELGALAILLTSAWFLREGIKAEDEFAARKIAEPPLFPRKLFAAILSGTGIFIAALLGWNQPTVSAGLFGVLGFAAHITAFGIDPLKRKGASSVNEFETDRVARAIDIAEDTLSQIHEAAERIGDRALEARIESFGAAVRDMFRAVESDPRDLTRARKFLGVYLVGARDATVKFADLYERDHSYTVRDEYISLISDLEQSFNQHRELLLLDDRADLDIEIEVLRDRLQQEGLKAR